MQFDIATEWERIIGSSACDGCHYQVTRRVFDTLDGRETIKLMKVDCALAMSKLAPLVPDADGGRSCKPLRAARDAYERAYIESMRDINLAIDTQDPEFLAHIYALWDGSPDACDSLRRYISKSVEEYAHAEIPIPGPRSGS